MARVFDYSFDEDGNAYIEMEYVPGVTPAELLARLETVPLPVRGPVEVPPGATSAEDQESRCPSPAPDAAEDAPSDDDATLRLPPAAPKKRAILARTGAASESPTGTRPVPQGGSENTTLLRSSSAPAAVAEPLEKTLGSIRALRDEGRAGEALKQLNLAFREFGEEPALKTLRYELSEALLARDAEEETASRMFEALAEPAPAGEPAAAATAAPAPQPAARGLHHATIRSASAVPPRPERPGPPVAQPHRGMLAGALVLAAVFALLIWILTRHEPGTGAVGPAAADGGTAGLPGGSVAIDAVPWAEIAGLEQPGVDEAPIPPSRFTPVILQLPPGGYVITLRYPPTGEEQTLPVRVESGVRVDRRVTFRLDPASPDGAPLDGKQYFERVGW